MLIHCSAGIHRTGTIAYTLMRSNGFDKEEALESLKKMRKETFEGVGENRLEIAETLYVPRLINN